MLGSKKIVIRPLNIEVINVPIRGISPLIVRQFGERQRKRMQGSQDKSQPKRRDKRDPEAEFREAQHRLEDGGHGYPAVSFRKALYEAAHKDIGIPKTIVQKGIFVLGDDGRFIRIESPNEPTMRCDPVKNRTGVSDLRYRPEYWPWAANLTIQFDADIICVESVVNLVERAGFGVGIGEWRPSCNAGEFGRFTVIREISE